MSTDTIREDVSVLNVNQAAEKILAMDAPEPSDDAESTEETEEVEIEEPEETEESENDSEETEEPDEAPEETEESDLAESDEVASYRADMTESLKEGREHYDHIKVPIKVNGVEGEATLTELVRDFQKTENLGQKTKLLASERAALDEEISSQRAQYGEALSNAASLVNQLEQQLIQSTEDIDWKDLRENDPAEFSAKKQEILERQQQFQNAKGKIAQEHQEKLAEHFENVISRESSALIEDFPEWADEKVGSTEKMKVREYLINEGFTSLEVDGSVDKDGNIISAGIVDHRAIKLAYKAMMHDAGGKKVELTKKRVRKLPKVARPGKPSSKAEKNAVRTKKLKGRLNKSGRVDDAATLIMDNLFGGS